MNIRLYLSLKEDVMDELINRYHLSLATIKDVLVVNKFRERFRKNAEQFNHIDPGEIAVEFYNTYLKFNA